MASVSTIPSPKETLTLVNRYQAAWAEHATRVAQRQLVVQIYLTSSLVIYGFWFTSTKEEINLFLIAAITLLTLSSSALMWMHNRVMQQLSFFMKNCEQAAKDSIAAAGSTHSISLFYFYSENGGTVDRFHRHQRLLHRIVLAIILAGTNGLAIGVTWNKVGSAISAIAIVLLVLSIGILFRDLGKDDSVPNR